MEASKTNMRESDNIFQRTKMILHPQNFRGFVTFLGLDESIPFSIPEKSQFISRLRYNLIFFAANYAILALSVAIFTILLKPLFLFAIILLAIGWYLFSRTNEETIVCMGYPFTVVHRVLAMTAVSFIIIFLFGGSVLFSIICGSLFVIFLHSTFRNSTVPEDDEYGFLVTPRYETI